MSAHRFHSHPHLPQAMLTTELIIICIVNQLYVTPVLDINKVKQEIGPKVYSTAEIKQL